MKDWGLIGFFFVFKIINLVLCIIMLINIYIILKYIFGFKDSIFWLFVSDNGFEFKDKGFNEKWCFFMFKWSV